MIIYEVNLDINKAIYPDYYEWLLLHVEKILCFEGFLSAEIAQVDNEAESMACKLRVSYYLSEYSYLKRYLESHAPIMRAEAIEKFGEQFSADRRVMTLLK